MEEASALDELKNKSENTDGFRVRRRGILRPALSMKNLDVLSENARNGLPSCRIQFINQDASKNLIPNLSTPCDAAFYLPDDVNINPQRYIQVIGGSLSSLSKVKTSCKKQLIWVKGKRSCISTKDPSTNSLT